MNLIKKIAKEILPPFLIKIFKKYYGIHYIGNFKSWQEAKNKSIGYEDPNILEAVKKETLDLKQWKLKINNYRWQFLSYFLLAVAMLRNQKIRVLDFGGAFGGLYFQHKKFLYKIPLESWSIVEQKHFVSAGEKFFSENPIKFFFYDIKSCIKSENPNILLLSGVLQFLEQPFKFLDEFLTHKFEFIIIDRTPFSKKNEDVIKIQIIPRFAHIYTGSYPCWFFDKLKFKDYFTNKGYLVLEEFDTIDPSGSDYEFKGMFLKNQKSNL
jgi:putative methyltransferase (TIGR04325 family)